MSGVVAKMAGSGGFDRDIRSAAFQTLEVGISIEATRKAGKGNALLMVS